MAFTYLCIDIYSLQDGSCIRMRSHTPYSHSQ